MSRPTLLPLDATMVTAAARDAPRFRLHKTFERSGVQRARRRFPFLYDTRRRGHPPALPELEDYETRNIDLRELIFSCRKLS